MAGSPGMAASAITYPLDFIRARLTVQTAGNRQYNGIVHGVRQVIQTEGICRWVRFIHADSGQLLQQAHPPCSEASGQR